MVTLVILPGKLKGPPCRRGGGPPRTVMYQSAIARGGPGRARTGTPVGRPRAVAREAVRDNGGRSPTASGRGASAGWRGVAARPARAIVPTRRSDPKADRNRRRPRQGFRQVAPAMALNGVELGEQRGQRRDADDQSTPGRTSIPSRATAARSSSRCSITSRASTASLAAAIWPRG